MRDWWHPYGDYDGLLNWRGAVTLGHLDTAPSEGAWAHVVSDAPARALGLLPPEEPRMPERTDSVEELVSPDIRQTIPSWKWYTSLRSTHGSSWARATRLDYSDYDEDRRSKRSKRKGGKRRGVKWAPLTVVPWMRPAFPDAVKKPKTAQKRLRTAVAKPPKLPKTPSPRRPRTVKEQLCCVSDGARDVVRVTVDGRRVGIDEPWPGGYDWDELVRWRVLERPERRRHAYVSFDASIDFLDEALDVD